MYLQCSKREALETLAKNWDSAVFERYHSNHVHRKPTKFSLMATKFLRRLRPTEAWNRAALWVPFCTLFITMIWTNSWLYREVLPLPRIQFKFFTDNADGIAACACWRSGPKALLDDCCPSSIGVRPTVRILVRKPCLPNQHFYYISLSKGKRKNYAGSENHSPHQLRKRSHFGTEYRKAPPPREGKENQWGSRGLQAWPEPGSWWELITVWKAGRVWYGQV